jgi:DNA-binding response OmpR family regulator
MAAQHEPLIFIVDDESLLGEMAEAVLSSEGFHSRVFTSPVEALDALKTSERPPALLVTDCVMQGMSGIDLIKQSRDHAPRLKTILLSGTVTEDYVTHSGVRPDRFIPKPYNVQVLISTVRDLLRSS